MKTGILCELLQFRQLGDVPFFMRDDRARLQIDGNLLERSSEAGDFARSWLNGGMPSV